MLKRNKFPPLPNHQQLPKSKSIQTQNHPRQQIISPPPVLSRLQRKPKEDSITKSNSLNSRLKRKTFQGSQETGKKGRRLGEEQVDDYMLNNDYYVQSKQGPTVPFSGQRQYYRGDILPKQIFTYQEEPSVQSTPDLPKEESWDMQAPQKRDQESVSTQLSKQSDLISSQDLKDNQKQVKFGGVMEADSKAFIKKRDKIRSPSILKNGGRNILNVSLMSHERSCSVASGREQKLKEKSGVQNNTNKIIKQKYKSILSKLQADSQMAKTSRQNRFSGVVYNSSKQKLLSPLKFKDEIFPPVYSSLFAIKKSKPKLGEQIVWRRLSDLFSDRDLVLARPLNSEIQITKHQQSFCEDYFPGVLNCLLGSPKILQKIFEGQAINPFGIYLIKIYQQSAWKYIIVDDYIPVIRNNENKYIPAFLSVKAPLDGPLDIWPFLLEKAYANYYARYEALLHGNMLDFLQELTGTPSVKIQLKIESPKKGEKMSIQQMEKALLRVKKQVKTGDIIALGQLFGDKGYIPLVYSAFPDSLYYNDPFYEFKRRQISFQNLKDLCRAVHVITPFKYSHCTTGIIRKTRPNAGKQVSAGYYEPQLPSVRTFKIEETGEYTIAIRQREKRLFHFRQDYGEYIWCRVILLQKEYQDNGYRWINGQYGQKKSMSLTEKLEAGEYWLLVEPQWRANSPNELMIQIFGKIQCDMQRVVYNQDQKILQSGCMDLAQRYGQLNQINKYICSYNFITEKVGLIIENIINERVNGDVTVMRSIKGLKCRVQILPINGEFYQTVVQENGQKLLKLNEEIELDIKKGKHFTVVLKLKGGTDKKFFKSFDFGC